MHNSILAIQAGRGEILADHQQINNAFRSYYQELYKARHRLTKSAVLAYIQAANVPKLLESEREDLERPVTGSEIHATILSLSTTKAPAPDWFPSEMYQTFADKLTVPILQVFLEAIQVGSLLN